jgi:hypothetical protein
MEKQRETRAGSSVALERHPATVEAPGSNPGRRMEQ